MNNNEKIKRFYASLLLSFSILLVGKTIDSEIQNSNDFKDSYDNSIIYEGNISEVNDDAFLDIVKYQNELIDSFGLEKTSYSEEEIEELLKEGTVIKKQYFNSPFCVYCIEINNARTSSGIVYVVPDGYKRYAELVGTKVIINGESKLYYNVTSTIRTVKVEQKDNIRTRIK